MKKTLTFISVALVALFLGSCVESSEKYKTIVVEKEKSDSTAQILLAERDAANAILRNIEISLQAIYDAEGMLMVKSENGDMDYSAKLLQIKEVMAENRARLDSLQNALDQSGKNNKSLNAQIKKLKAQLAEKEEIINGLEAQIAEKNDQIAGLNNQVDNLNKNLSDANKEIQNLTDQNLAQETALNTVYYIGATKKELKNKGIILSTKNILKSEAPTEEFTKADKRDLNSIVFNTKKAVVLSNHPVDSYNLVKGVDENGKKIVTLEITNPEAFWTVTKYLVALTK